MALCLHIIKKNNVEMKLPLIILGLGNEIFGDDAAGILAAEKIEERINNFSDIKVETSSYGGLRIVELLKGYNSAIIIDTIQTNLKPIGYVHKFLYNEFISSLKMVSFHTVNFTTAIDFGRKAGIIVPDDIFIFAIEAKQKKEFSEEISEVVKYSINQCVNEVLSFIKKNLIDMKQFEKIK